MTTQLKITDIQFTGADVTNQKLRRLVDDLIAAENAVNALLKSVASTTNTSGSTLLADPALTSAFSVSGLAAGEVLQALSATSAAFAKLSLGSLAGVSLSKPVTGQVLTYENGSWVNATPTATPSAAVPAAAAKVGTGASIYAGVQNGTQLAFKAIVGDAATISVTESNDTVKIKYIGPLPTGAGPVYGNSIVDSTSTGTLNDYTVTGFNAKTGKVAFQNTVTLNGIDSTGWSDGASLLLIARASATITLEQLNAGSLAANQIGSPTVTIPAGAGVVLRRDNALWVQT